MERRSKGMILTLAGVLILALSVLVLLPLADLYLLALISMFAGVVLIGIGGAMVKEFDNSLEAPEEDCYYCSGTGRIEGSDGYETCPRCGGTGLARPDDYEESTG
ncbi:hypothetical protein EU545_04280 [Candidatus Thorarchaeota archaeon]|nr:MAG: hypothetical protein EU545_04280 [Candidatus Thorarchaeota archaeon]